MEKDEEIIQGIFYGWVAIENSQDNRNRAQTWTKSFNVIELLVKNIEQGRLSFYSIFSIQDGNVELQEGISSEDVPGSFAYRKNGRWFVGRLNPVND